MQAVRAGRYHTPKSMVQGRIRQLESVPTGTGVENRNQQEFGWTSEKAASAHTRRRWCDRRVSCSDEIDRLQSLKRQWSFMRSLVILIAHRMTLWPRI